MRDIIQDLTAGAAMVAFMAFVILAAMVLA